jgi:flagellar biosynthesis/type III secretory pathway protein FliH
MELAATLTAYKTLPRKSTPRRPSRHWCWWTLTWKLRLLRLLYQRGISADDVRELFRMVDWLMDLPSPTSLFFDSELRKIEQEYEMPYVTSIERRAIEKGIEQGIEQGIEKGIEQGIEQGIEKGIEKGFEQGVVFGQIQLLQRILGIAESSIEELRSQSPDSMRAELERLQKQLASR